MKLQEVRTKRDLSQWDLKLLTDIHQTKISLIESGYLLPTDEERRKMAVALGVDPGELVFELKQIETLSQTVNRNNTVNNKN
jgi:ribosome-binding protein aMBF1 (putative translation factor)